MAKKKNTFEEQLRQLEDLVEKMEREDIPLEEALSCYEDGIRLSQSLNKILEEAQQKVEILSKQLSSDSSS